MSTTDPRKGDEAGPSTVDAPALAEWRAKVLLDVETLRAMFADARRSPGNERPEEPPSGGQPS